MALIVTLLATPPFGATQSPDDLYIVRPTPALRVASDDLTTVLLVNNEAGRVGDNHGRFLSVRPEVGLLTSTARTFIQEGITTEYATQVVGTTLDNGRLYAQYLKKSSRVLFENGHVAPSVVTSWVGEGGQTRSYLQSHNDLFNADDADWQDLDDRLGVFVGNTDFVRAKAGSASSQALPLAANNPGETAASYSVSTSSSSAKQVPVVQLVGRSGHIEENARKLAAQKVLPIGDLPTYTVKNHFEPSGYTSNGDIGVVVEQQVSSSVSSPDDKDDGRSPKVYYQQLMTERNDLKPGAAATFKAQSLPKRVLSTVTYYGFADFTTVVGDSVIVFSPSTAQPSGNFGHVTSIKGKATLSANHAQNVPQASVESSQPQATIEATKIVDEIQIVPTKVNSLAVGVVTTSAINDSTDIKDENDDTTPAIDVSESTPELTTPTTITTPTTPTSPKEEVPQKVAEDASTIKVKPMFSLPTDQEILEIYASLSKAQAQTEVTKDSTSSSVSVQNVEAVTAQIKAETTQSNLQVHGGATTIFFEDDPFANFVEPTTTTSATILTTATTTTAETPSVKSVTPETSTEEATTVANEPDVSTTVEDSEEETTTAKAPAADQGIVTEKIVTVTDAPDVVVKEISPNETDTSALAGCSTTKQVFLTQLPKTLTILNTQILRPDGDSNEEETSIETSVLSTYEILETTKYYCIQATQVLEEAQRTDLPQLETPVDKDVKHAVTEATLTSTESTSEEDTTTVTTEAQSQEEMATTEVSEHDTSSTMKDDEGSEYDNEDYEVENDSDEVDLIYKTLYTTYTYLTTFFQGDSSTVSSHTEIVTNVITSTVGNEQIDVKPTDIVARIGENEISATQTVQSDIKPTVSKYMIPDELSSRLHDDETNTSEEQEQTISNDVTQRTSYLDDTIYTKTFFTTYTYFTTIFAEGETEIMSRTEVFTNFITKTEPVSASSNDFRTATPTDTVNAVLTQEQKSEKLTLSSQEQAITNAFKNVTGRAQDDNEDEHPIDDQVSSESNTEEIIPSATLLLQTSFTTFTFYTTMYVGDNTNVISRLETVTNVATETLQPTRMIATEDATLPITYFTTFTYWTKLAKNGEITTISREETISNVIEPTNIAASSTNVPQTIEASAVPAQINDGNANSDQETEAAVIKPTATVPELTTYYTTYTYYTTSYDANKTITDSRFETITNVVTPTADLAPIDIASAASKEAGDTGSSGSTSSNAQSVINTSKLLLYDYKHIIDADGVSTLYFTTQIHSTVNEEGNGIEITSSTSSLYIDETKKANIPTPPPTDSPDDGSSSRQYKTGLVRLIEGTRIGNSTTTLYQSKVIGTVIDNRYAQIIESTSSFLFEKTTTPEEVQVSATISPTATDNTIVPTQQVSLAVTPAVVEGSISDGVSHEESEGTTEADPDADDDGKNKAKLPFQTKKRTFAPVIRPFASRNRPTFAPKQKTLSASSATIITRSDITPTITATPALKTVGRYASSRKGATSNIPIGLSESSSSRRTFGRPIKSSIGGNQPAGGLQSSSGFAPSRSRFASSSRAAPVSSSRRINPSFRPSSGLPFRSGFPSINLPNARPRIRPTASSGALPADSATATAQSTADSSAEEESSTQDQTNDEEETTTENSRRNQNPLLRFRRPLNRPSGFTPIPRPNANSAVTISPRRNPLSGRVKSPSTTTTTTTTARPRPLSFQRPTISSLQARTRPQSNLFPPRGLFQQQQKSQATDNAEIGQSEGESENDSEYDDDEGDDESETNANRRRRQSNKSANHSRVRRQAEPLNRSRFRFRRPKTASTTTVEEPKSNEEINETTPAPRAKINSRFGSRYQSPHRESTTATTTSTHRSIRPTRPTSNRTQFTLREKDTTPKGLTRPGTTSNFRRQQPSTSSSLRRPGATTSSNRRLKSYSNHNTNNNVDNSGRTSSGSRTRNGNLSGSTRGRGSVRSRNRNEYNSDQQSTELGSVTITVTHVIPAEVTVPVVNGQITEYKNIVTGKTSTEVLGPHQYTNSVGNNGQTSLYLTREDSTVNFAGATEITRYLLHDSATTTITFTPTTIRGRKTSFSHVLPSTVYSVENVVSTVQPQISANAPLANILLSQLLLGNINLPSNPLLGALGGPAGAAAALTQQGSLPVAPTAIQNTPVTEYRTHTSTYVTTIFDGKSTVLPVTFQGKKILTTVYDTTAQTITATEFVTDTIVTTPTQMQQLQLQSAGQVAQVNSLLLQQLLLQQQQPLLEQPLQAITHTAAPNLFLTENLQDLDAHSAKAAGLGAHENIDDIDGLVPIVEDTQSTKSNRKKNRKSHKSHKRNKQQDARLPGEDSTVITLYVSGRTPGEFSTILSTVQNGYDHSASLHKRQAYAQIQQTTVMDSPEDLYMSEGSELVQLYLRPEETDESRTNGIKEIADELEKNALVLDSSESKAQTVSLESIVGDVGLWYAKATSQAQVVAPTEEAVAATSESKNTLFNSTSPGNSSNSNRRAKRDTSDTDAIVTNATTTVSMRRFRKVLVRRKPLEDAPSLVNNKNSDSLLPQPQISQPKRHRVVIFKHRISTKNQTELPTAIAIAPTPSLQLQSESVSSTSDSLTNVPIESNSSNTSTSNKSKARPTSANKVRKNRRRRPKTREREPRKFKTDSVRPTMTSEPIVETDTIYKTSELTTTATELLTRTYTYVVDRVHDNQHEIQSYSTFTRVSTRTVPQTLTITSTSTQLRTITIGSTQPPTG
ncbi:mucin-5AC [Scaptodrosophila lebanonensis]|uniref:Mucin-5AC n=1 Tax=Drosophila lebanonensis TaxID=7225 RepID=A0A6J2TXV6_DROLE|nr:mucin-5AC [Scaptodrosophila lebanonensis]